MGKLRPGHVRLVLTSDSVLQEPPIWLYVQSMSLITSKGAHRASQIMTGLRTALPAELLLDTAPKNRKKKAYADLTQTSPRQKKKRVQFVDAANHDYPAKDSISPISQIVLPEFDLCQTQNMCHYIKRNYGACASFERKDCLGYLETPCHMYKHKFYLRTQDYELPLPQDSTVYTLFDIMGQEPDDVLTVEDQLKLALKTAIAILQYNDTPWLADRWRLNNISYFGSRHKLDGTALQTLHLSSQISQPKLPDTTIMEDLQSDENTVSAEIKYGINNLPIFFLGVALLEIAHWKPLESKMISRDQKDQVYTARRLALGRAPLGPEYQKIVSKCLQCNFGMGTELSSKSLQTAVYNDVVCGLEGMIERLAV